MRLPLRLPRIQHSKGGEEKAYCLELVPPGLHVPMRNIQTVAHQLEREDGIHLRGRVLLLQDLASAGISLSILGAFLESLLGSAN